MKKLIVTAAVVLCAAALSSCDSKLCYCYDGPVETTAYTNNDTPCNALSHGGVGCVEQNERMREGGQAQDV